MSIRTAPGLRVAEFVQSLAAVRRDCPDLPSIPMHVLTAGGKGGPNVKAIRRVHEAWKAAAAEVPAARYTNIPVKQVISCRFEAPEPTVIDAIAGVLEAVRVLHDSNAH